jgi:hypothetical protein
MSLNKKIEFSYGNEHKESMNYIGLIAVRLIFKCFGENLIQLLAIALGEKLFSCANEDSSTVQSIKISKVFELKSIKYIKFTKELKNEHCCFMHFLLGKKRNMSKHIELEVCSLERNRQAQKHR